MSVKRGSTVSACRVLIQLPGETARLYVQLLKCGTIWFGIGTVNTSRGSQIYAGVRKAWLDLIVFFTCHNPVAKSNCPVVRGAIEMRNYIALHNDSNTSMIFVFLYTETVIIYMIIKSPFYPPPAQN